MNKEVRVRNVTWKDYGISPNLQKELKASCMQYGEKKKRGVLKEDCQMIEDAANISLAGMVTCDSSKTWMAIKSRSNMSQMHPRTISTISQMQRAQGLILYISRTHLCHVFWRLKIQQEDPFTMITTAQEI